MKDFSLRWPVLTRFGEHEEIMKRLALYMDWGKVEEPEQADLLLEHYQKDVGRLIRTLTFARTPHYLMAGKVIEYADNIGCPMSAAIQIMFFMYRQLNVEQGIPLGSDEEFLSMDGMKKLLDTALLMVERDAAKTGGLPCVACKEPFDTIPELLQHLQSAHPQLKEGSSMAIQENENGGETQADASVGVTQSDEEGAAQSAEDAPGDDAAPKTTESEPEELEEVEGAGRPEPALDAPSIETEMAAGSNGDSDEDVEVEVVIGEPDTQDEVEQPRVDEAERTDCIAIIIEMHDVTSRNHMKSQDWWDKRLAALREFIITV
jgi:hypothetical protein